MTTEFHRDLEQLRRDLQRQSESISSIVTDQRQVRESFNDFRGEVEKEMAVRAANDIHLNRRLDNIDLRIKNLYTLGLWVLGAFAAAFLTSAANFVINGGLIVAN